MRLDAFMQNNPANMEHAPYAVRCLQEGVWMIEDGTPTKSCSYVVEGADSAALIDTGSECGGDLLALVASLTSKPVKLLVTHGHPDHASFLDRVERFYMSEKDIPLLVSFTPENAAQVQKCVPIDEATRIDLGGVELYTISVPGHSPGSVLFADPWHGYVFSGDAFGSGEGVWLQVPEASNMSEYLIATEHALARLDEIFPERNYVILPGHAYQMFIGVPGYVPNPVNRELLLDMAGLCRKVLCAEITPTAPKETDTAFTNEPVLRVQHGRASAVCIRSRFQ